MTSRHQVLIALAVCAALSVPTMAHAYAPLQASAQPIQSLKQDYAGLIECAAAIAYVQPGDPLPLQIAAVQQPFVVLARKADPGKTPSDLAADLDNALGALGFSSAYVGVDVVLSDARARVAECQVRIAPNAT